MIENVYGNPWIHMINQAILANPAPLVAPPSHTKGVCPPYSGPSKRTRAKRAAKRHPRRGTGNCGRQRS